MTDLTLLGISGSLRRDSTNRHLLREAARLFGDAQYIEADLRVPLYDGDEEDESGIPAAVQTLADQIAAADGVMISSPEYNKGPSGVLKNALDWVSRVPDSPWSGKPVVVMSAAAGRAGGERAQAVLRGLMVPFRPRILQGPEMHLAACTDAFNDAGRLQGDFNIRTLQELMDGLKAEIAR